MKVLNLACSQDHLFEGWFGSEADFQQQRGQGLLTCPLCGDAAVEKRLSAPRLNLKHSAETQSAAPMNTPDSQEAVHWLQALRALVQNSEDVGDRFATEAQQMHHGEIPTRAIRGRATWGQAAALLEEGIEVLPLPDLPVLKEPLQ